MSISKLIKAVKLSKALVQYRQQQQHLDHMQNLKQQLKSWEQNSPSHMQMVQQQPFSLLGDPDTKMQQLPGFDQDRQQLAAAMAGDSLRRLSVCFVPAPWATSWNTLLVALTGSMSSTDMLFRCCR